MPNGDSMKYLAFVLLGAALAIDCPAVSCTSLSTDLCASRTGGSLQINSNGCPAGTQCSAALTYQWWFTLGGSLTYACQSTPSVVETAWSPRACKTQQSSRNFKSLNSLVLCSTDQDCVLQDGSYASGSCICALRSGATGTCQPDPSNSVFAGYWTDCGADNEITDKVTYDYWAHYMTNWVYLQSDLSCYNFLLEVADMAALKSEYDSAAMLAFTLILVL